jgi:hypothetical protein
VGDAGVKTILKISIFTLLVLLSCQCKISYTNKWVLPGRREHRRNNDFEILLPIEVLSITELIRN